MLAFAERAGGVPMVEEEREGKRKKKREPEAVIPLRRPYMQLFLGLVLFAAGAYFFYHRASTNDRGLIINGIIHLGPDGADVFYAVMAVLSAGLSVGAAFAIWKYTELDPFRVVLGAKSISLPTGAPYRMKEQKILYRDIRAVSLEPPAKPARLVIHSEDGAHGIPALWMPSGHTLQEVADQIIARMRKPGKDDEAA